MLPAALYHLYMMRMSLQEALTDFAPAADPVLDPLIGQILNQLPDEVKPATVPVANPHQSEQAAKRLQDLILQANVLNREVELL